MVRDYVTRTETSEPTRPQDTRSLGAWQYGEMLERLDGSLLTCEEVRHALRNEQRPGATTR